MTETNGKTMIRLEHLSKVYPGSTQPAVDDVTMDIPEGEIVIFVGPSGCGKTTTMRLINRLIEPSSGRIILEGEDVTRGSPDQLRRRMGYVIQQVGLFPHWTIEANISLVPKMLGWDGNRVSARVDELLTLVGMDPATFRKRYPKQLSGGQRQRVGVARALAADPPVMLMDEPFGAVDPINRDRLQNEFLRLQREIRKTIVFVTHDIDEAIKMGDRICILREGSRIAQYDTPENILAAPADAFVADFLGAGASLKALNLMHVSDVSLSQDWATASHTAARQELLAAIDRSSRPYVLLLDEHRRPVRWLSRRDLQMPERSVGDQGPPPATVGVGDTLHSALNSMLTNKVAAAAVIDDAGVYRGVVDMDAIRDVVDMVRDRARQRSAGLAGPQEALTR